MNMLLSTCTPVPKLELFGKKKRGGMDANFWPELMFVERLFVLPLNYLELPQLKYAPFPQYLFEYWKSHHTANPIPGTYLGR